MSSIPRRRVSLYTTVVAGFSRTHFLRITPCGSIRKNVLCAVMIFSLRIPYARMTFRSTKSLSSGYGRFRDSAKVCCENGLSAPTARI
jgi:hypothetical protein